MSLAVLTAQRATCLRRKVGCVLLNHRGHVLSTGYNGVASGQPHCSDTEVSWTADTTEWLTKPRQIRVVSHPHACPGAHAASGTNLDGCEAIHAEQNALLQCRDIYMIDTAYVTASPCMTCTKLLLNTGCQRIVYLEEYPHPAAKNLWIASGKHWEKLESSGLQRLGDAI